MCWSAWGVDVCATFAPEYKDTVRDTKLALRSAALFSMVVYIMLPIAFVGGAGAEDVAGYAYVPGMKTILGTTRAGLPTVLAICLVASFVITMNTATADGGRALFGISRDGMTSSSSESLNRYRVPGNGDDDGHARQHPASCSSSATSSACSPRANLGYVLAHMFALSGFVLLRQDRPNWPRPIKLGWDLDADRRRSSRSGA